MNVGDSRFSVSRTPRHCRRWWEILTLKKGRMLPGYGCPELAVYWRKKYRKRSDAQGHNQSISKASRLNRLAQRLAALTPDAKCFISRVCNAAPEVL